MSPMVYKGQGVFTQRIYDAQARAITHAERIALIQAWVHGQERRGYTDPETAALICSDLDELAAFIAAHRETLANLRNSNGNGKP